LTARIRASAPKVYVDGQMTSPLEYGPAATMKVQVPGEGVYRFILFHRAPAGWIEAGQIHDNVIEFQAGGKQIRIECDKPLVDSARPVFIRREP
jgi:hypothetical protein